MIAVLSELPGSFSPAELKQLEAKISRLRFDLCAFSKCERTNTFRCMVGIKKLLDIVDLVKQTEEGHRVPKFLCKMEEEGGLEMT